MSYEGEERREKPMMMVPVVPVHCIHESDWGEMTASIKSLDKRINGSLRDMEKHMDSGKGWRMSLIGIIVAIFLQIIGFSYLWGGQSTTILSHDKRLTTIETLEIEAQRIRATNVAKIQNLEKDSNERTLQSRNRMS